MRKFALLPLFLGLSLAQVSFGQVRDLFAEFEEEAKAPATPAVQTPATPASSVSKKSKKSKSSSSVAVSSSSEALPSSSSIVVLSSSSEAVAPTVAVSSAVESSSSVAAEESSSSVADLMSSAVVLDTAVLDSATRDSLMREAAIAEAERVRAMADSARRADSLAQAQAAGLMNVSSSSEAASSNSVSRRDLLGPVKVSKVHGIDEMKGRYKNPRKALFLSLLVPGAGQMYVGGSTATYVRGGVYIALEVLMWSGWGYFSIYKYNDQVKKYKRFAKDHYSIGRYEVAMRNLYNAGGKLYSNEFNNRYMGTRKSFCEAIYGDAGNAGCYHENALYEGDSRHLGLFGDKDVMLGDEMNAFSKETKRDFNKESELFQLLSEDAYVLGWEDAESAIVSDLNLETPNSETASLSKSGSDYQRKYRSMRRDANDYADMQAWFIGGLILNHIVSAVDAALTANAHNKVLYEEDVSWYDRLHFDSGVSFKDSFGWTVRANWGF